MKSHVAVPVLAVAVLGLASASVLAQQQNRDRGGMQQRPTSVQQQRQAGRAVNQGRLAAPCGVEPPAGPR